MSFEGDSVVNVSLQAESVAFFPLQYMHLILYIMLLMKRSNEGYNFLSEH